jgi:18S rRNA (guanine1575-N7)-methyltransferase
MGIATKAGFTGGLVVDYPNSKKAKKFYLVLMSGPSNNANIPKALGVEDGMSVDEVQYEKRREKNTGLKKRKMKRGILEGDKDWILRKKSLYRQRGKEGVPKDSKSVSLLYQILSHSLIQIGSRRYTGRKRKANF